LLKLFNEYFVTIAENIRKQTKYTHTHVNNNDVDNHIQFINHAFDNPFPNMENKYSTIENETNHKFFKNNKIIWL
jgi:hypothetical protein